MVLYDSLKMKSSKLLKRPFLHARNGKKGRGSVWGKAKGVCVMQEGVCVKHTLTSAWHTLTRPALHTLPRPFFTLREWKVRPFFKS